MTRVKEFRNLRSIVMSAIASSFSIHMIVTHLHMQPLAPNSERSSEGAAGMIQKQSVLYTQSKKKEKAMKSMTM